MNSETHTGGKLRAIAAVIGDLQEGLANAQGAFDTYHNAYTPLKGDIEAEQGRWDEAISAYKAAKESVDGEWQEAKSKAAADPNVNVDHDSFRQELRN